jgi:hypothetical protein
MKHLSLTNLFILLLVVFAGTFSACKKDELKKPLVQTSPHDINVFGKVGDILSMNIDVASDIRLSRFYITTKIENSFLTTPLDTQIDGKSFSMVYEYKIPAEAAGKSVVFTFNAIDVDGNRGTDLKQLLVKADTAVLLTETTGHQIFSAKSLNHKDAYNLETNSVVWSQLADSTDQYIKDFIADTTDAISHSWVSPAKGKFVRFNGFDYPNASDVSAENSYNSGAKLDIIDNLQINDILIVKLGSVSAEKYVVIKITAIADAPGKEFDTYTFSIKK